MWLTRIKEQTSGNIVTIKEEWRRTACILVNFTVPELNVPLIVR